MSNGGVQAGKATGLILQVCGGVFCLPPRLPLGFASPMVLKFSLFCFDALLALLCESHNLLKNSLGMASTFIYT